MKKQSDPHRHGKTKYYTVLHQGDIAGTILATSLKKATAKAKKLFISPVRVVQTGTTGWKKKPANRRFR